MPRFFPRRIVGGVSDGVTVVDLPKHRPIDPSRYSPREVQVLTQSLGKGSKWLLSVSEQEQFDLIREVLERNGVRLGDPRGVYRGKVESRAVGVSDGQLVSTIEVRFDGNYAHGYPCPP